MTLSTVNPSLVPALGSPRFLGSFLALCCLLPFSACRSPVAEPAPPPSSYELASAPPGARGARAAGTDAAPPRPTQGPLGETETEEEEEEGEPEVDAGRGSDAGLGPGAAGGV